MRPIKVVTDSSADLTAEQLDRYGIGCVDINYVVDGEIRCGSPRWKGITPEEMDALLDSDKVVKTSQPKPSDTERAFREYLDGGYDIFYLSISSGLSGSVNGVAMVARELLKEYPEARIEVVDSRYVSTPLAMLAIYASRIAGEGADMDSLAEKVRDETSKLYCMCSVRSLDYFKRNGRIKADKAFLGNLMGIKPLLTMDDDGYIVPMKKVRGWRQVLEEMAAIINGSGMREGDTVYIVHSFPSEDGIRPLLDGIEGKIPCNIHIARMCPIASVICGPESVIIAGNGTPLLRREGKQ